MNIIPLLKKIGFSENEIQVYLAVLKLGPSPVRKIAEEAEVNRGTTYDILKSLLSRGIVSYYHKEKKQYFVGEDPEVLLDYLEQKRKQTEDLRQEVKKRLPELRSLLDRAGGKIVAKYYEGPMGIKNILRDLIVSLEQSKKPRYVAYSSSSISPYLYTKYSDFTKQRIEKKIHVQVIAFGDHGDEVPEYAERKWLTRDRKKVPPNYILIYAGKVAFISVRSNGEPVGVLIEDKAVFETQLLLFNALWKTL